MTGQGRRVRGAISGLVCGFGIAVLLQQFAVLPLTTAVLLGIPVGMALVGIAVGWPRRGGAPARPAGEAVAAAAPVAPVSAPPDVPPEPAPPEPT